MTTRPSPKVTGSAGSDCADAEVAAAHRTATPRTLEIMTCLFAIIGVAPTSRRRLVRRLTKAESAYGTRRMISSVPGSSRLRSGEGYGETSVQDSSTSPLRAARPARDALAGAIRTIVPASIGRRCRRYRRRRAGFSGRAVQEPGRVQRCPRSDAIACNAVVESERRDEGAVGVAVRARHEQREVVRRLAPPGGRVRRRRRRGERRRVLCARHRRLTRRQTAPRRTTAARNLRVILRACTKYQFQE